jgi:acyl-CoA synthetase (AMP-forming)/AMP-acid ligase II
MTFYFPEQLRRAVRERPDHLALTDTTVERTYAETARRAVKIGHALLAEGAGVGSRVAYLGRNTIEFVELMFGCALVGAVVTPLNWRVTPDEIAYLVHDSEAVLAVVEDEFAAQLPIGLPTVRVGVDFERWIADRPETEHTYVPDPDHIVLQSYTSGTTSLPKGVLFSNASYGRRWATARSSASTGTAWCSPRCRTITSGAACSPSSGSTRCARS